MMNADINNENRSIQIDEQTLSTLGELIAVAARHGIRDADGNHIHVRPKLEKLLGIALTAVRDSLDGVEIVVKEDSWPPRDYSHLPPEIRERIEKNRSMVGFLV